MSDRVYHATLKSIPLAAATAEDLVEINAAAEQPFELISVKVTQAADSGDSGDANEDQIDIIVSRITGTPTSGSGGTTVTATKKDTGDTAFGGAIEMGNTTNLTGGTEEEWDVEGENNRVGYYYLPPPEERLLIRGDEVLIIKTSALHTNGHEVNVTVGLMERG